MSSRKEEWWHPTLGHFTTALGQPLPWSLACSRVPFHTQPELLQCIPRFLLSASRLTFRCNRLRWKVSRQTGHGAVFDAVLSERETIECAHFITNWFYHHFKATINTDSMIISITADSVSFFRSNKTCRRNYYLLLASMAIFSSFQLQLVFL